MSKRNRELHQAIASLNESRKKYFNLLDEIKNDRYYFPVIMNMCSYDTAKKLPYDELIEVNQIADLKLEKELIEKELSRQSKFESLGERVEKYRLTQTKKLIKQGMGFEKARKEAFKRSLMSDKDKRRLEYKELAKESKAKNKMIAASQGKGLVTKIAIGSALGNVISNAMSKVGGGLLGFAKKSVEETSKTNRTKLINSAFFTKEKRDKLMGAKGERGIISGMSRFERDLEKEEFLHQTSVFKGALRDLDKLSTDNLKKAIEFSAMLKSSGAMSS